MSGLIDGENRMKEADYYTVVIGDDESEMFDRDDALRYAWLHASENPRIRHYAVSRLIGGDVCLSEKSLLLFPLGLRIWCYDASPQNSSGDLFRRSVKVEVFSEGSVLPRTTFSVDVTHLSRHHGLDDLIASIGRLMEDSVFDVTFSKEDTDAG